VYIDHKGDFYSINVEEEDRFDYIIKKIKRSILDDDADVYIQFEVLLEYEFGNCRFPDRVKNKFLEED
jgi:hypothetical protein